MHRSFATYAVALAVLVGGEARSQPAWRPEKPVEIIVPTGAGGANDMMARVVQKTLQDQKLVSTPVLVMNKAGGNQTLGAMYLRQHSGDPHYLLYSTSSIFTTQLTGLTPQVYTDLSPSALVMVERTVFSVSADSPMKNIKDLVDRLLADPQSIAVGLVSRGGTNHLALSQTVRAAGVDPKKLKVVVFKTNVESLTALIGGHIQLVASSATAALDRVQSGQARMLGISAPQRETGPLANVPTLREQGYNISGVTNWRGIFGPPGMSAAQIAFWESAMARVVASDEWKKQLDINHVSPVFLRSKEFTKWLESEYAASRAALTDLGYAKSQ
jgi:putative tricarboxylic transport membrane protein